MAKFQNLSIDYKQLLKKTSVGDRLKLMNTTLAKDILSQLTPVERAKLFPKYYLDKAASAPNAVPPSKSLFDRFVSSITPPIPDLGSYAKAEPQKSEKSETETPEATAEPTPKTTTTEKRTPAPRQQFSGKGSPLSKRRQAMAGNLSDQDRKKIIAIAVAEEGNKSIGRKRLMETMFNRADAYKMPINSRNIQEKYYSPLMPNRDPGGYRRYQAALDRLERDPSYYDELSAELDEVISGSNLSNYATQNSSLDVAERARKGQSIAVDDGQSDLLTRKDKKGTKYYDKREDNWFQSIQEEERLYAEEQAKIEHQAKTEQERLPDDPTAIPEQKNQTGDMSPDILPQKTEDVSQIAPQYTPEEIAEHNESRPQHLRGKIRIGDEEFEYGSGAKTKKNFPSVPYGTYIVGDEYFSDRMNRDAIGLNAPGMSGNRTGFDPKINRDREGIVFHANNSNDLDRLYSHGCITVRKKDWPRFKKSLLDYKKKHGTVYLHVSPDGSPLEISPNPVPGVKRSTPTAIVQEKIKESKETGTVDQGLPDKISGVPEQPEPQTDVEPQTEPQTDVEPQTDLSADEILPSDPTAVLEEDPNQTDTLTPDLGAFAPTQNPVVEAPQKPADGVSEPQATQTPPPTTEAVKPAPPAPTAEPQATPDPPKADAPAGETKPVQSSPDVPMMKSGGEVQSSGEDLSIVDNNSNRKIGEVNRGENIRFNKKGRVEVTPAQRIDPRSLEGATQARQSYHDREANQKQEVPQSRMMQGAKTPEKPPTNFTSHEQWGHTETPTSYVRAMAQAKGRKHDGSFPGSRFGEEQLGAI